MMSLQWIEPEDVKPPQALLEAVGGHPLVAETLFSRGITDPEAARAFLDPAWYQPASPSELPGLMTAVEILNQAITNQETILVWGDFDVDGQTSTSLLVEALHKLGGQVVYYIPVRDSEGHGIQTDILEKLLSPKPPYPNSYPSYSPMLPSKPAILLTCDTGIDEHEAVDYARSKGLKVIITDHHELPPSLPEAEAILNPHLLIRGHPLRNLPGVGVAYKLVEGIYESRELGDDTEPYLDLVALGIVADVAELRGDNRYLLQRGLEVLRKNKRPGLAALYEIIQLNTQQIDSSHIGFTIGPRLNALGRLEDAKPSVEFLTTHDSERADFLANKLDRLNQERRRLTEEVTQGALAATQRDPTLLDSTAFVLAHPGWPRGIIGIVASRLVEKFNKPVVLLSIEDDGIARGSARSVEGVHLADAIGEQADLLIGYGGHAGAAGLSLHVEDIPAFRARLSRTIKAMTAGMEMTPRIQIDAYITLDDLDIALVDEIERLAPFGPGNPPLILGARNLGLVSQTSVGRENEHLRLVVSDSEGIHQDVLWWRGAGEALPEEGQPFDLAFHASSNTFRGERRLQLEWVDYKLSAETLAEGKRAEPVITVTDYRDQNAPVSLLNDLTSRHDVQVWVEGPSKGEVGGQDRQALKAANKLVIWTIPPSPKELKRVLEKVKPEKVYAFAASPDLDDLNSFLLRLTSLVKYVINQKEGRTSLEALAAGMAHTTRSVETGLRWLAAKGKLAFNKVEAGEILQLAWTDEPVREDLPAVQDILSSLLEETAAYRQYYQHAEPETIFSFGK